MTKDPNDRSECERVVVIATPHTCHVCRKPVAPSEWAFWERLYDGEVIVWHTECDKDNP